MSLYLFLMISEVMSKENCTAQSLENIEGQTLNNGRSCVRVEKLYGVFCTSEDKR